MSTNLRFSLQRAPWSNEIEFWCHAPATPDRGAVVPDPLVFRVLTREQMDASVGERREPFLRLNTESAQRLMDELWHCGLRPSEGTGSAGSLAATQKHLADMRALVAKTIGVELPK